MEKTPSLSFVIPAYNEEAYIGRCLQSLTAELKRSGHNAEIIVVNNASTDSTEKVAEGFPGVHVVREEKKGLTRARQRGLIESTGEWVINIDADSTMRAGWITKVLSVIASDPSIVCVSGPNIFHDLSFVEKCMVWSYWIFLGLPGYWIAGYMVQGGNFAAKRSALEAIGGFDTNIEFYGEDTNVARRLHKVGKVVFLLSCYNFTSARRIEAEGAILTVANYVTNFLSEALFKKPAKMTYKDHR